MYTRTIAVSWGCPGTDGPLLIANSPLGYGQDLEYILCGGGYTGMGSVQERDFLQ